MSKQVRLEYVGGGPRDGDVEYEHMVPINHIVLMGQPGKRHMGLYFPRGHRIDDPATHRRDPSMVWHGERRYSHIDYGD